MSNRKIYLANRGCGKTEWLTKKISEEFNKNPNRTFLYIGNKRAYDHLAIRYLEDTKTRCPLIHAQPLDFDNSTEENTVCFTDDDFFISDETVSYQRLINKRNILWYITMSREDFVD